MLEPKKALEEMALFGVTPSEDALSTKMAVLSSVGGACLLSGMSSAAASIWQLTKLFTQKMDVVWTPPLFVSFAAELFPWATRTQKLKPTLGNISDGI